MMQERWTIKSCGKAHPHCRICDPSVGEKLRALKLGVPRSAQTRARLSAARQGVRPDAATRAKMSAAHRGKRHSPEVKAAIGRAHAGRAKPSSQRRKLSAAGRADWAQHHDDHDPACTRIACIGLRNRQTSIEHILLHVVLAEFPTVEPERSFGRYRVDAYLPSPYHLAFEADGAYWHGLPGKAAKDAERDADLLAMFDITVVRLTEPELRAMV